MISPPVDPKLGHCQVMAQSESAHFVNHHYFVGKGTMIPNIKSRDTSQVDPQFTAIMKQKRKKGKNQKDQ